jgi:predicted RNA binding protein YcfA (HicA-like mRNA interferase family)
MKRIDLIRHLESHGCMLFREGGRHSIYKNPRHGVMTAVPRHREVKTFLARKICDDLAVPRPF